MRRLTALLLLTLLTFPAWSQSSSEASNGSPICFTTTEYAKFQAEVQAEFERTALEAAEEAVKPHLQFEADLQREIASVIRERNVWRTVAIGGIGAAAASVALLLLLNLKCGAEK